MVKGAWYKNLPAHRSGLKLVQKKATHALNSRPFTFLRSILPCNVQFWAAHMPGQFFAVIFDACGTDL